MQPSLKNKPGNPNEADPYPMKIVILNNSMKELKAPANKPDLLFEINKSTDMAVENVKILAGHTKGMILARCLPGF